VFKARRSHSELHDLHNLEEDPKNGSLDFHVDFFRSMQSAPPLHHGWSSKMQEQESSSDDENLLAQEPVFLHGRSKQASATAQTIVGE
jgi:hypothetical protein